MELKNLNILAPVFSIVLYAGIVFTVHFGLDKLHLENEFHLLLPLIIAIFMPLVDNLHWQTRLSTHAAIPGQSQLIYTHGCCAYTFLNKVLLAQACPPMDMLTGLAYYCKGRVDALQ